MKAKIDPVKLFFASLDSEKIVRPVREFQFYTQRKWRFDYCWPEYKIALEVEGGVWSGGRHTRGSGFVGDMEKYNHAATMGWRIIRVVPADLSKRKTISLIKQILIKN